tara:strand:- start:358 stop:564 length:207 start_codon:yes stop_codon:yes gene_type:complete
MINTSNLETGDIIRLVINGGEDVEFVRYDNQCGIITKTKRGGICSFGQNSPFIIGIKRILGNQVQKEK